MQELQLFHLLLMATYYVLHPEQYLQSRRMMFSIIHPDNPFRPTGDYSKLLPMWGTTFHALSIVAKRESPAHRDPKTCSHWFDLLISAGRYDQAFLYIPSLRTQFLLLPGTLSAFSGQLFRHSVTHAYKLHYSDLEAVATTEFAERFCLAYYLRRQTAVNLQIDTGSFAMGATCEWEGECYAPVPPDL